MQQHMKPQSDTITYGELEAMIAATFAEMKGPIMDENERQGLLDLLAHPFEASETSQRQGGGGKMFTYIAGDAVIQRLNETTIGQWSSRLIGQPMVQTLETHRGSLPCLMAFVELEIPGLGAHVGCGVQMIEPNAGEDVLKGAITDAMKNAAKYFGVGLYLYGGGVNIVTGASNEDRRDVAPARRPQQSRPTTSNGDDDGELASPNQMGAIYAIGKRLDWDDATASDYAESVIGVRKTGTKSNPLISKSQASQLIEALDREGR